ncbi:MAG: sensor domain-containing diguanylate cyclase [Myxococcota bacterium]|jgi:diguanylate cyclase (GGDEF)-like protein
MSSEKHDTHYQRLFPILFEITKMLNSGAELHRLLRYFAERIVGLLGADSCTILLLDADQRELLCRATSGATKEEEDRIVFRMGEGVTGWAASHGAPALVADVRTDKRCSDSDRALPGVASILCVPLKFKEEVIGAINVTSSQAGAFDDTLLDTLTCLGNSAVQDVQNARLYMLSVTDPLTRVMNRQFLFHKLPEEIERSRRYQNRLSIILMDMDRFNAFNQKNGMAAGDDALKFVARSLSAGLRDVDSLSRIGGGGFIVVLPQTSASDAMKIAARLKAVVEDGDFSHDGKLFRISVSAGGVEYSGSADSEGFIRQASSALLTAKDKGGSRIECYHPIGEDQFEST